MLSYNIMYLFLFLFPFFLKKKYSNLVCFLLLLVFMSVRYNVGWDFRWYYPLGTKFQFLNYSIFLDKNEALGLMINDFDKYMWNYARLEFLNKVLYHITWYLKQPQIIIVLYSFLSLIFIKLGFDNIKEKKNIKYAWLFFYCFPLFFFKYVNIMRQSVAISIVFYSYKFLVKKSLKNFLICILIATLFHSSAKYMVVLYLLNYIKFKRIHFFVIYFISFFSKTLLISLIDKISLFNKYMLYIRGQHKGGGEKIYYIILLLGLIIILLEKKLILRSYKNKIAIYIVFIGCCIYMALNGAGHIGMRSSVYFLIFILYLIPSILNITRYKNNLLKLTFVFMLFVLLNINLILDQKNLGRTEFVPYRIFFLNPIKLEDWEP